MLRRLCFIVLAVCPSLVNSAEVHLPAQEAVVSSQQLTSEGIALGAMRGETVFLWLDYRNLSSDPQRFTFDVGEMKGVSSDFKHLLAWYKDANARKSVWHSGKQLLVEELLVNDPELVVPDHDKRGNRIKFHKVSKKNFLTTEELEKLPVGKDGRIRMSAIEYPISDSEQFLPRTLAGGESGKLLLALTIGPDARPGRRKTNLSIRIGMQRANLPLVLIINPYVLKAPNIEYSIFYRGLLDNYANTMSSERKTPLQLKREFAHISAAKYVNPVIYQPVTSGEDFEDYMKVRMGQRLSSDKLYFFDSEIIRLVKAGESRLLQRRLERIRRVLGPTVKAAFMVDDEPSKNHVANVLSLYNLFHKISFGIFISGKVENFEGLTLPAATYVFSGEPKSAVAADVHSRGGRIFSYANPQVGVIVPLAIRFNYGFSLLQNDYDGAMLYAYQDSRGSLWSDFDGRYRDHMFSYPISSGLLDTVSWVAYRQAITDASYYQTLLLAGSELNRSSCVDRRLAHNLGSLIMKLHTITIGDEDNYRRKILVALDEVHHALNNCLL
ncbi:MAG: hypothetical protein KC592_17385 [Nitrospira sp.]|nr:hypothetical protein [Nitrospira sp.]